MKAILRSLAFLLVFVTLFGVPGRAQAVLDECRGLQSDDEEERVQACRELERMLIENDASVRLR